MDRPRRIFRRAPPRLPGSVPIALALTLAFAGCTEKPPTSLDDGGIPTGGPYSATVQRIFNQSCNETGCHGVVNPGAGLELISWERLVAGSRFGEVIIAFRPEESHLIDHLTGAASPRMPLSRDPLPESQIETIRRWVAAGARNDGGEVPYAGSRRKIIVTDQGSDKISVIDAEALVVTRIIDVGVLPNLEFPHNVHVDPQNRYWYVTLIQSGQLLQFDAQTDSLRRMVTVGQSPANPVTSPDGGTVYVTNWNPDNATLHVLDTETMTEKAPPILFPPGVGTLPHGLCVASDGRTVYTTHQGGDSVFKIVFGKAAGEVEFTHIPLAGAGLSPLQIILDAGEEFAYVTCFDAGEVQVIDTSLDAVVEVIDIQGKPWLEALTPDGRRLYVGNWGKDSVDVIDTETKDLVDSITNAGRPDPIFARPHGVAITDDGRYAFVSNENTFVSLPPHHGGEGGNGTITVIEVATNRVVKSLEVEKDPTGVAFVSR